MKLLTALCLLIFGVLFHQNVRAQNGPSAREAIEAVIALYAETWNANDIRSWGSLFTNDVDYVHRGGGWWRTNEENVAGHLRIHERLESQNQAMNLTLTVESVYFLRPDIALVHVTSRWPEMEVPGAVEGAIMTMIMLKEAGKWRIRALQNTLVSGTQPEVDQSRNR